MSERKNVPMTRKLAGLITAENKLAPTNDEDTTPTPPDAVREALIRLLNRGRDIGELCEALGIFPNGDGTLGTRLADALLTRPSDARGREAVAEYALRFKDYGTVIPFDSESQRDHFFEFSMSEGERASYEKVQRTVTTTDWTPLSPTQEGA